MMEFWERIDAKARENFFFGFMVQTMAISLIVPSAALILMLFVIYPMTLLVFPIIALGWILKVGFGK